MGAYVFLFNFFFFQRNQFACQSNNMLVTCMVSSPCVSPNAMTQTAKQLQNKIINRLTKSQKKCVCYPLNKHLLLQQLRFSSKLKTAPFCVQCLKASHYISKAIFSGQRRVCLFMYSQLQEWILNDMTAEQHTKTVVLRGDESLKFQQILFHHG